MAKNLTFLDPSENEMSVIIIFFIEDYSASPSVALHSAKLVATPELNPSEVIIRKLKTGKCYSFFKQIMHVSFARHSECMCNI